jgi:hypothetical protein
MVTGSRCLTDKLDDVTNTLDAAPRQQSSVPGLSRRLPGRGAPAGRRTSDTQDPDNRFEQTRARRWLGSSALLRVEPADASQRDWRVIWWVI